MIPGAVPRGLAAVAASPFPLPTPHKPFILWRFTVSLRRYGDGWQQARDGRKEHDPQWWALLHFDAQGVIQNLSRPLNWTVPGCAAAAA